MRGYYYLETLDGCKRKIGGPFPPPRTLEVPLLLPLSLREETVVVSITPRRTYELLRLNIVSNCGEATYREVWDRHGHSDIEVQAMKRELTRLQSGVRALLEGAL